MDSSKYIEKCLSILDNEKFIKITGDPTKRIECKIQRCVRKIKNKISKKEYLQLYPTGSSPGKFYELPKFTSQLMVVILLNFLLGLQYRIFAQHRITYQSIQLNSCHHLVNQNILLKIQKYLSSISGDYMYQRIITNWYYLMYHHYLSTCPQITLQTLY